MPTEKFWDCLARLTATSFHSVRLDPYTQYDVTTAFDALDAKTKIGVLEPTDASKVNEHSKKILEWCKSNLKLETLGLFLYPHPLRSRSDGSCAWASLYIVVLMLTFPLKIITVSILTVYSLEKNLTALIGLATLVLSALGFDSNEAVATAARILGIISGVFVIIGQYDMDRLVISDAAEITYLIQERMTGSKLKRPYHICSMSQGNDAVEAYINNESIIKHSSDFLAAFSVACKVTTFETGKWLQMTAECDGLRHRLASVTLFEPLLKEDIEMFNELRPLIMTATNLGSWETFMANMIKPNLSFEDLMMLYKPSGGGWYRNRQRFDNQKTGNTGDVEEGRVSSPQTADRPAPQVVTV